MKNYTITVNGNVYDVTVEENGAGAAPVARPAAAPKAAPAATPAPKKKGDAVLTIEAMKMEIPVVAPEDGTVASIDVAVGDAIDSGAVLATLN